MNECLCVVLNKNFFLGFKALMNSILANTKNFDKRLVCLDIDLDDYIRDQCKSIYPNIHFINVDAKNYRALPRHAPALENAFFKLDLFKLASSYDKIVFVDTDIVFVDSIQPLFDMSLQADLTIAYHTKEKDYNTGVMLFKRLQPDVYDKVIALMNSMKRSHLGDQPVIIKAMRQGIVTSAKLDPKWNTTKRQVKKGATGYCAIHYVGKKPWRGGEPGYEQIEEIWNRYV